jgi:hypothetical protein
MSRPFFRDQAISVTFCPTETFLAKGHGWPTSRCGFMSLKGVNAQQSGEAVYKTTGREDESRDLLDRETSEKP